jgi:hypothetical protein
MSMLTKLKSKIKEPVTTKSKEAREVSKFINAKDTPFCVVDETVN